MNRRRLAAFGMAAAPFGVVRVDQFDGDLCERVGDASQEARLAQEEGASGIRS